MFLKLSLASISLVCLISCKAPLTNSANLSQGGAIGAAAALDLSGGLAVSSDVCASYGSEWSFRKSRCFYTGVRKGIICSQKQCENFKGEFDGKVNICWQKTAVAMRSSLQKKADTMPHSLVKTSMQATASLIQTQTDTTQSTLTSKDKLVGTWLLDSLSIKQESDSAKIDLKVATSGGISKITLKRDGSFFIESEGLSQGNGSTLLNDNCTEYENGLWVLNGAILTLSQIGKILVSGVCERLDLAPVAMANLPDQRYSVTLTDDENITLIEVKESTKAYATTTYKKQSSETWDGTLTDPRFIGVFKLTKLYLASFCSSTDGIQGEMVQSGDMTLTAHADLSYLIEETNYVLGPIPACTGTSTGTFSANPLFLDMKQTSNSVPCTYSDPSVVWTLQRDIVTSSNLWVSVAEKHTPKTECENGEKVAQVITISQKSVN